MVYPLILRCLFQSKCKKPEQTALSMSFKMLADLHALFFSRGQNKGRQSSVVWIHIHSHRPTTLRIRKLPHMNTLLETLRRNAKWLNEKGNAHNQRNEWAWPEEYKRRAKSSGCIISRFSTCSFSFLRPCSNFLTFSTNSSVDASRSFQFSATFSRFSTVPHG